MIMIDEGASRLCGDVEMGCMYKERPKANLKGASG